MEIFLLSFVVLAVAILGMAIGVLFGRRGIMGSCGGLKTIQGLESHCPVCSGTCEDKGQESDA